MPVVAGKSSAECVCYTSIFLGILDVICIALIILGLVTLPDSDDVEKYARENNERIEWSPGGKDEFDRFMNEIRFSLIFILIIQLTIIAFRVYGMNKLWQSFQQCETNLEEAKKSADMAFMMIMGICVADFFSFVFIPGMIIQSIFLCCCINDYRDGIRTAISQSQMMGGWAMIMLPSGNPMMMSPSGNQMMMPSSGNQMMMPSSGNQMMMPSTGNQMMIPSSGNQMMIPSSGNQMMMPSYASGAPPRWPANSNVVYPAPPSNAAAKENLEHSSDPRSSQRNSAGATGGKGITPGPRVPHVKDTPATDLSLNIAWASDQRKSKDDHASWFP